MQGKEISPEVHERVKKVLNSRFDLELTDPGGTKIQEIQLQWDLIDRKNGAFAEIVSYADVTTRADVQRRIDALIGFMPKDIEAFPIRLYVVFMSSLSGSSLHYFRESIKADDRVKIYLLDWGMIEAYEEDPKLTFEAEIKNTAQQGDTAQQGRPKLKTENIKPLKKQDLDEIINKALFSGFIGKFWWLNADQKNWPIEEAVPGNNYAYPKRIEGKVRRGFNSIDYGDIVISYQKSPERRIAGIYQVAGVDDKKVIFRFVHELPNKISWKELNELDFFRETTIAKVKATGSAFALEPNVFVELISRASTATDVSLAIQNYGIGFAKKSPEEEVEPEAGVKGEDLLSFETEENKPADFDYVRSEAIATDHGTVDSLDFEQRDAQALAALIALEKMEPPLAIALFGQWGSGKSFFMQCIEQNIRVLSEKQAFPRKDKSTVKYPVKPKEKLFLQGIAHIKFNAWSYLDANLWAGLAHSLFEKLNEYITENSKGDLERLRVQLKISQRLKILHSDLNDFKEKKDHLLDLKRQLEDEKEKEILRFFDGSYDKAVLSFLNDIGLAEGDAKKLVPSKLHAYVEKAGQFTTYLKRNGMRLSVYTLGALAVGTGAWYLLQNIDQEIIGWGAGVLATITPFVSKAWKFALSKAKTIETIQGYIEQIEQPKSKEELSEELGEIHKRLAEVNGLIADVEKSIEQEQSSTSNISQLAIANFVSSRPEHEDYKKHLGIITTIRKDFETLSELFYKDDPKLDTEHETKSISKDRKIIDSGFKEEKKLDRIVLYIDDLDRCSDEKVLEVLQAVHLLMAFPLFIVLVGVDERCVHNALTYRQLKRYKGIDRDLVKEKIFEIEPREYLEKIFQIPFQLPIATPDNIEKLIESIVPDTVEDETVEDVEEATNLMEEEASYDQSFAEKIQERSKFSMFESAPQEEKEVDTGEAESVEAGAEDTEPTEDSTNYVQPEKIGITEFEKNYLKKLSILVGRNPRTIKRYVNIARIVKTHESEAFKSDQDTVNTLFLIAFVLGEQREVAIDILKSGKSSPIWSIIGKSHKELETLLSDFYANDNLIKKALTISPTGFTKALRFVERFSYRTALKEKEEAAKE